jgi:hypothetical protein
MRSHFSWQAGLVALICFALVRVAPAEDFVTVIEQRLDLASDVVVGQITKIEAVAENMGPDSHCGRATVNLTRVIKGNAGKAIKFLVVTRMDPNPQRQRPLQAYSVGDQGIWIVENGWAFESLDLHRQAEIQADVKMLADRKWSKPVNGLRAWALVTREVGDPNCKIIFAVDNVSDETLYIPSATDAGFVFAAVTDQQDHKTEFSLRPGPTERRNLRCEKLAPGGIIYLHPDSEPIDLAWRQRLAPGKYSVVIYCTNKVAAGKIGVMGDAVAAWTGEVAAPAVEIVVPVNK